MTTLNEDGSLRIEKIEVDRNVTMINLKCNYCSKVVLRISDDTWIDIEDKHAMIACSGCKGVLI